MIMTKEELKKSIIDEVDEGIYVVDIENFNLLYANKKVTEFTGATKEEIAERPCYKTIFGLDNPCENCPNNKFKESNYFEFEQYNPQWEKYVFQRCRKVNLEGRDANVCIVRDVTGMKQVQQMLSKNLKIDEALSQCFNILSDTNNIGMAINHCLSCIAEYYDADRAYIFEFAEDEKTLDNTYEWCGVGIEPQIDFLQNVEMSAISRWFDLFNTVGSVLITRVSRELDKDSLEYKILEQQDVEALMAIPLTKMEKIVGFIGVDNPKDNLDTCILLKLVAGFILNAIEKGRSIEELWELSFYDRLTKVGNRHAYVKKMEELEGQTDTSLGIIFADINGLKQANDLYGHERGDAMIIEVAEVLKANFDNSIYRIGGDEFVVFCKGVDKDDFEKSVVKLKNSWSKNVNASIGSMWLSECSNIESSVAKTDRLMYREKKEYYGSTGVYVL